MIPDKSNDIEEWMRSVAEGRTAKKKLIFDKETKTLVAVEASDPRIDDAIAFTPKEATRFLRPVTPR